MPDKPRVKIARQTADALVAFEDNAQDTAALVGFDGFVDSIIAVVDKRQGSDPNTFDKIPTIDAFGQRIIDASGESTNFELVVQRRKLGGNGPIMANAFVTAGLTTTYVGALGRPTVDEVFKDFARAAECVSIAPPGMTDALEFSDGKLMLGKLQSLGDINWNRIDEILGGDVFLSMATNAAVVAMVNWTMLPNMNTIWQQMLDRLTPHPESDVRPRPIYFFDLADPSKRTADDIKQALDLIARFEPFGNVVLGLNLSEGQQVAAVLGQPEDLPGEAMAAAIRTELDIHTVVIHLRDSAVAADRHTAASFKGPFVKKPLISTGAGDHFNAGYCLGLLAGLDLDGCLCTGTATSGYYVRNAASPTLAELTEFCRKLPPP